MVASEVFLVSYYLKLYLVVKVHKSEDRGGVKIPDGFFCLHFDL